MNILISSCLLGVSCRYDGKKVENDDALALISKHNLIPFCPEIYGGLSTPRDPAERIGTLVLTDKGADVTEQYTKGAEEALRTAKLFNCSMAILKEKSPSCGRGIIHNGAFDGGLVEGNGVTAELLEKNGITVIGESKIKEYFS